MLTQYYRQVRQDQRPIRYFAEDESRFGLKTLVGRLITACGIKPIGQWQWLNKKRFGSMERLNLRRENRFSDNFLMLIPSAINGF